MILMSFPRPRRPAIPRPPSTGACTQPRVVTCPPAQATPTLMPGPFDVTISEHGGAVHVTLSGELDISTAPRLEDDLRRVESDGPSLILLDLSGLDFMDSTGLRLLISADARARA